MGLPKGQAPVAKGLKGRSGRKSAYQERGDADTLHRMYFNTPPQDELEARISSGKATLQDRHLLTAMEGDVKALNAIFSKVFPDKLNIKAEKNISDFLDELDSETQGQTVADEPLIQDQEQKGEVDHVPTEPSASGL